MGDLDTVRYALETIPNEDQHETVFWRWCITNYETIREALQNKAEQADIEKDTHINDLDIRTLKERAREIAAYRGYIHHEDTPITYELLGIGAELAVEYIASCYSLSCLSRTSENEKQEGLCNDFCNQEQARVMQLMADALEHATHAIPPSVTLGIVEDALVEYAKIKGE